MDKIISGLEPEIKINTLAESPGFTIYWRINNLTKCHNPIIVNHNKVGILAESLNP
jgi:hypothetical protein